MPTLDGVRPGDKVNMTIRMYFGLTEIKIECVIRDKTFVFTSSFDASDSYGSTPENQLEYPGGSQMIPPPTAGLAPPNPYGLSDPNGSQVSLGHQQQQAYTYGTPTMAAQQAGYSQAGGYPPTSSVYGGGYPPVQGDYYQQQQQQQQQQQYAQQGYPPSQSYYSGYPPSSQGYPPQSGSSYYGQH